MADLINGPWEASGTEAFGLSEIIAPNADFKEGHLVAVMNDFYFKDGVIKTRLPREMVDARARLLAAAPSLLEASKKLLDCLNAELGCGITEAMANLRTVISKADGNS